MQENNKRFLGKIRIPLIILLIGLIFLIIKFTPNNIDDIDEISYSELHQIAQQNIGMINQVGDDAIGIDPMEYLTTWNFNNLPENERSKFYKETPRPDGSKLREYWLHAVDKEIEVAPGIFFPAWAYNGQVPGPTIRATEGDLIRIYFINDGTKPHTMHFHGFHTSEMDGAMKNQFVNPGDEFFYEFEAEPYGSHLYHCHSLPVSDHIHRGLYGTYIVDPKNDAKAKADKELIMMMNGFDVNFDGENEIYALNSIAFYYADNPIKVKKGELVRIYLTNMLEFDQINSFHLHANFFDEYKTGTGFDPDWFTDTTIMGQGERSILDIRFKNPGNFMFHAHKTEFAELGWMGFFEVEE
jgi:manganese oxidase